MGCGCGGRNNPGRSSSRPLILGENGDYPTVRVKMIQGSAGGPAGTKRWVKGSSVQEMIESGALLQL